MTEQEMSKAGLERKSSGKWGLTADPRFLVRIAKIEEQRTRTLEKAV